MNKNYLAFGTLIRTNTASLLLLMFFLVSSSFYGQIIDKPLVPSSSPLVVPAGIISLTVNCWGAGGGGGGSNFTSAAGGGGGGGSFKTGTVTVTPVSTNAQISYTVGQGGTGGTLTTMNGVDGEATIFSTVTANGGKGGKGATSSGNYGAGGSGGVSVGGNSGGNGASATNVLFVGLFSGGGGGGAGSGAAGTAGTTGLGLTGGAGGTGGGGDGGTGMALVGSGGNGSDFGGGGGGGLTLLSLANSTGGKGGNGQITVGYTCPTYSIANNVIAADACVSSGTSIVTLSSSAAGLPIGTYTVVYDRSLPAGTDLEATMEVTTAGSGTFTAVGLTINGTSIITITKLKSVDCISTIGITANVSVTTFPSTPVLGTTTQPNCMISTGSVVLTGLPVSGTVNQAGTVTNNYTISNATGTMTITGLAAGTYTFSVSSGLCLSSSTGNVIMDPPITKTWNGSAWSPVGDPSLDNAVIFSGNATITAPLNACSCQINSGVDIVVGAELSNNNNAIMTIKNGLNVQGTLTFENNASLIQTNENAINIGKIKYKRNTSLVRDFDYVYWCSPVEDQVLNVLSPSSDKYYSHASGNWVLENGANAMNPAGKGFIIRVPRLYTTYSQSVQFEGKPHNGLVSIAIQATSNENLIGNPYPCAIDADSFINHNTLKIGSALYFWTHNTPRTLTGSKYVYTSADYATYTLAGGTGTDPAPSTGGLGVKPLGKIAAGQSFFVLSIGSGFFEFNNLMRISTGGLNSQFFKPANDKKSTSIEKNRVWLNMTNDEGAFKQLLVGYMTGATNGLDKLYDGESLNGNKFVDFYSISDSKNFTIQARGLPFDTADAVPLGYKTTIAGTFQIGIDDADGFFVNQPVYLEDKMTNSVHDLKSGAYSFTTAIGEFNERFVLRYTNTKLGTGNFETTGKGVVVLVKNHQIMINSFDEMMSSVKVYDLKGSLIYEKKNIGRNTLIIDHLISGDQVLVVMTDLENGKKVSEKIVCHN